MKSFQVVFLGLLLLNECESFVTNARLPVSFSSLSASTSNDNESSLPRRQALERLVTFTGAATASMLLAPSYANAATATTASSEQEGAMYAPKFVQTYDDFKETPEGWSYREVTKGKGDAAAMGDRVVYDWSGYTIGKTSLMSMYVRSLPERPSLNRSKYAIGSRHHNF
jgi:hypothetical protein